MKSSIFSKILATYSIIILCYFLIISLSIPRIISKKYISNLSTQLTNLAYCLKPNVRAFIEEKDIKKLNETIKKLSKKTKIKITVLRDVTRITSNKIKNSHSQLHVTGKGLLLISPIYNDKGKPIAIMQLSTPITQINQLLSKIQSQIFLSTIIITLLSILLAFILSNSFSNSIDQMTQISYKIARGQFDNKINIHRHDELGELATALQKMSQRLRNLFTAINQEKEKINIIISSLQEPLCLINQHGIITMCNKSFENLIKYNPTNKPYWQTILSSEALALIKSVFQQKHSKSGNIQIGERFFLCGLTFIPSQKEIILILHDITSNKKLEQVKKDFITNASHELRTPLTAIKGYIETLEEEIKGEKRQYITIIKRHIDRLSNIVKDLLVLSKIEHEKLILKEKIDIKKILKDIIKIIHPKIKQKGLKLELELPSEPVFSIGDSLKIEQAIINLLDNAIKYTEKGHIKIQLLNQKNKIILKIIDTGIGIPKSELSRIFERFYVVDKSRSRKLGGTGLGLSIVKHIILLHNGNIEVKSQLGKGSQFIITLPTLQSHSN